MMGKDLVAIERIQGEIERINNINIDHITAGNYIIVPIFVLAE